MGVLAPGSVHARPSAWPPINTSEILLMHVYANSLSNISTNQSEVITKVLEPLDNFAYRYNDLYQAYNSKSKIAIFANEKEFKQSEKEIKDEILILIHMIQEDLEVQIHVKEVFDRIKSKGIEVLNKFFELLVDKDYQTLYEYFK
jgi:hypothetical protein